jgi:hypothetical protein
MGGRATLIEAEKNITILSCCYCGVYVISQLCSHNFDHFLLSVVTAAAD